MQETQQTWVRFLGLEDTLEKGTATHCSVLAWEIPCTEEPGGLQSVAFKELRHRAAVRGTKRACAADLPRRKEKKSTALILQ